MALQRVSKHFSRPMSEICYDKFISSQFHIDFALQFSGRQCEEEVHVEVPGFVGHSLLVHHIDNDNDGVSSLADGDGFSMFLSFQTSSPDGVIFYRHDRHLNDCDN